MSAGLLHETIDSGDLTVRHSWDQAMRQIKVSVAVDQRAMDLLCLRVLALNGTSLAALTVPGHDPPVAWRVHDNALARLGIPVIACPSFAPGAKGHIACGAVEYMDPEPVILDAEPGQRR